MRVLLADDSQSVRYKLSRELASWGYDVRLASDGEEALHALSTEQDIRIAILDWYMPGHDGPTVCSRLRALGEDRYVYVVMLTSVSAEQGLLAGMESGADHYIVKNSSLDELRVHLKVAQRIVQLQLRSIEDGKRIARSEQFESMARLAGSLAHELNTPFQFVATNLEYLRQELGEVLVNTGAPANSMGAGTGEGKGSVLCSEVLTCLDQSLEGIAKMARIVGALQDLARSSAITCSVLEGSAQSDSSKQSALASHFDLSLK